MYLREKNETRRITPKFLTPMDSVSISVDSLFGLIVFSFFLITFYLKENAVAGRRIRYRYKKSIGG